ncbi:MAG: metal-dependent hydrolase [Candidatus Binatia bacterium]|nr:metal-dependent hydrolase [Candidatus Binatia bacterium]MDG2011081.1 metal-dependent hydrolase [Candidatus Binatia bacterium]
MLDTIKIRQMPFDFPDEIDPVFMERDHRRSFSFIAGSLLLPYLEPYLIRSMKAAEKHVTDPKILEGLKGFSAQEGQHYRIHMKFNAAVKRAGFPGLEALEKELSDDYQRFTKTKSLRFNLAYAEGFEAITMNLINSMMGENGLGDDLPDYLEMIQWHFVEELEHRTVAFDVYDHVCGGYFYRLFVGAWAQWHFISWIHRTTQYMLKVRPQPKLSAEEIAQQNAADRMGNASSLRSLIPALLGTYLPTYTPHQVEIAPGIQPLADKYTAMALKVS